MRKNKKEYRRSMTALIAVVLGFIAMAIIPTSQADRNTSALRFPAAASCVVVDSQGRPVQDNHDPLIKLLATDPCPSNVFELRSRLLAAGAKIKTTLVANRGVHNPKSLGDFPYFSMFEIVSGRLEPLNMDVNDGEFFFGHFTGTDGANRIFADQRPNSGALMIELIVFDPIKQVFNFYELIGDGGKGKWFYRGDSLDILADLKLLHRQPSPAQPQLGGRLRCSACHMAGGPIMKELEPPHNDWSRAERQLPFGNLRPDAALSGILRNLVDASELSKSVKAGLLKLGGSERFQSHNRGLSLQEQLRPLFCPVELNLESDLVSFDRRAANILIPSPFFVHPMLAQGSVSLKRSDYDAALTEMKAKLPESARPDADHGWLTPVKAFSDTLAIERLIKQGVIDQEFAMDVLAVDLTNPLFSRARCGLLRMLPAKADGDWKEAFKTNLRKSQDPAAQELFKNLTDPNRGAKFHQARAARFLSECQKRLQAEGAAIELYRLLAQRRAEVGESEISKHPKGKILEPGFRVIFPEVTPKASPNIFRLTEEGRVIRQ